MSFLMLWSICVLNVLVEIFLLSTANFFSFVQLLEAQQQQGTINQTAATLSQARSHLAATSSGELVFFGGGRSSTGQASDRVDIYNVTSGSWTTSTLSIAREQLAATSSQNLVFFDGGLNYPTYFDRVDIYNTSSKRIMLQWRQGSISQPHFQDFQISLGLL
jgi:hypothetical protein